MRVFYESCVEKVIQLLPNRYGFLLDGWTAGSVRCIYPQRVSKFSIGFISCAAHRFNLAIKRWTRINKYDLNVKKVDALSRKLSSSKAAGILKKYQSVTAQVGFYQLVINIYGIGKLLQDLEMINKTLLKLYTTQGDILIQYSFEKCLKTFQGRQNNELKYPIHFYNKFKLLN